MVSAWFPMEAADMAAHIRMLKEKDEPPVSFYDGWTDRNNHTCIGTSPILSPRTLRRIA